MKLGDKVKFNNYLPLTLDGKQYKYPKYFKYLDTISGEEKVGKKIPRPIIFRDTVNNITTFTLPKIVIKEKIGIYIGSKRMKLVRIYDTRDEIRTSESRRFQAAIDPFLDNNGPDLQQLSARNTSTMNWHRPRDWTSRNPRRLDNPYELEEIAIIATSKTKRYLVPMKSIFEYNISDKIKVL